MSIRAYKLIEIKTENAASFNCWQDNEIMAIADDSDNSDIITIKKERAEELKELLTEQLSSLPNEQEEARENLKIQIKNLGNVIADCGDEDYCEYYCY